jgi:mannonate dehydratase
MPEAASMRLSMVVNPPTDRHLQWAAQVGVTDIVIPYPGLDPSALAATCRRIATFGMRCTHVERKLPHLGLVHGLPNRDEQVAGIKTLLGNMADNSMEVLCYNWMPDEDWQRTSAVAPARGGARATAFRLADIGDSSRPTVTDADGLPPVRTSSEKLWEHLHRFLDEVVPVAEACGIRLALHPDDPPLDEFAGQARIMHTNAALLRATELVPSHFNAICYCVGSLHPAGEDVIAGIEALNEKIAFVHARNVRGTADDFVETWHDDGAIDMPAVIRALKSFGYTGTVRPDHAPSMAGESNETPGYEMLGRLFAAGYLKGLFHAA